MGDALVKFGYLRDERVLVVGGVAVAASIDSLPTASLTPIFDTESVANRLSNRAMPIIAAMPAVDMIRLVFFIKLSFIALRFSF